MVEIISMNALEVLIDHSKMVMGPLFTGIEFVFVGGFQFVFSVVWFFFVVIECSIWDTPDLVYFKWASNHQR